MLAHTQRDVHPQPRINESDLKLFVFLARKVIKLKLLMWNDELRSVSVHMIPKGLVAFFPSSVRAQGHGISFHT